MKTSSTEENYIKAIFKLESTNIGKSISTNEIGVALNTKPATVTDMIKRLSDKKIISYEKYYGVHLTKKGKEIALNIVRKHRLWEVFLVKTLNFKWDEVHEIAEQLEHINSPKLINELDNFLGNPKYDPHGDAIPNKNGKIQTKNSIPLSNVTKNKTVVLNAVLSNESKFLQYLTSIHLSLGDTIKIESLNEFDHSYKVKINNKHQEFLSNQIASLLLVYPVNEK